MGKGVLEAARRDWVLVALGATYVAFRIAGFAAAEPRVFTDTEGYERIAAEPVLSGAFLAGARPPVLPLLYAVIGGDEARIWAQALISIACWLFLAGVLATSMRRPAMRWTAFAAILMFSLGPEVVLWDATLLSESLSVSLLAALVASWILILRTPRPSPRLYAGMLVVAAAWALTRDPHAYPLAALGVAVAVWAWLGPAAGGSRKLRAAVAGGLVLIAAVSVLSANIRFARWVFPLQNVISLRISAEPEHLAYFEERGMPTSPILLAQMETFRSTRDGGLDHPPGFDGSEALAEATPFHRWLRSEGREAYSRFLLTHPGVLFGEGLEHLDVALLDPQVAQYASSSSPWDGAAPSAVVNPRRARLAAGAALLAVSLALAAAVLRGPRREWAAPAALLALCLPFALFVYHGGALEPARHGVVPSLMLRLGALTLLLFALDRLAERRPGSDERTARRRPAETVEAPAEPAPA